MLVRATAKIKITATSEIISTINIYKQGLQFCIDTARNNKIRNNIKLHPFVYKHLRSIGLPAQLAVACIKQACGMIKKAKSKPVISNASIRYNFPRSASCKNNILSISTIKGRIKVPFNIPDCYTEYFSGWNVTESLLQIDNKGRCFFMFCFAKDINTQISNLQVLGIDVGINQIAVTSNKQFFNAKKVKLKHIKYQRIRSKLQAKGTKSARKLLRKISGREKRFMAWVNHNISKSIVDNCNAGTIVMENLKGIRKTNRGKRMNYWISNWSFFQLQNFIRYKAERQSIKVVKASPFNTSKICSRCGNLGSRSKGFFHCSHCNYSLNADLNASFNLAKRNSMPDCVSVDVNQPYIPSNDAKASSDDLRQSLGINNPKSVMPHSLL